MAGLEEYDKVIHVTNNSIFVKCNYCDKDFTKDWSRRRHEEKIHGVITIKKEEPETGVVDPLTVCSFCEKAFSSISNKRVHERRQHGAKPGPTAYSHGKTLVRCTECNVTFSTLNNYRTHLLEVHHIESHKAQHVFTSEQEFLEWKDSLEMDIGVNYTSRSGSFKSCDGMKQIFYCRRSGAKSTKFSSKKRAEKSQGTCKIGFYCTSSIEVVKKNGKIYATLYSDHRDHDLDSNSLVYMTVPKSEQDKIAGMITQGINHNKILDKVREASGGKRTSFLKKKDIDNICVRYGIKKSTSRQSDDNTSVRQEQIKKKILSQVLPKCNEIKDPQVLKTADNLLHKLIATLDSGMNNLLSDNKKRPVDKSTVSKQSNKKYSTKKRKLENVGTCLKKPSAKAKQVIG